MRRFIVAMAMPIFGMAFLGTTTAHAAVPSCSASSGHVGMVVEHGDGSVVQFCVGISGNSASGQTVLANSGAQYGTVSYGGSLGNAVCQIDHEPQSYPPSCFQSGSPYWEIFVARAGGSWSASQSGLSGLQLTSGDALGFRYEQGGAPPVTLSIACPPPVTASQATPTHSSRAAITTSLPSNLSSESPSTTTVTTTSTSPTGAAKALHMTNTRAAHNTTSQPAAPSLALLLAFLCGGGFLGLLTLQVVRRR